MSFVFRLLSWTECVFVLRRIFIWIPFLSAMTIKKKIQTKFRLPILNWTPLKPQQLKGTIFSDLDDEKLYHVSPPFFYFLYSYHSCYYYNTSRGWNRSTHFTIKATSKNIFFKWNRYNNYGRFKLANKKKTKIDKWALASRPYNIYFLIWEYIKLKTLLSWQSANII